jgi:dehydrogenase/reductase SDR family member 7B
VKQFEDHVAVVTGAASGIGKQLAWDLAVRGSTVVGVDVQDFEQSQNPTITPIQCDLADVDAYVELLAKVEAEHGRIDILANVAGIDRPVSATSRDLAIYRTIMQVNFFAPLAGTLTVVPGMVARGRGYVVNVSSDSIRSPIAGASAYIASKGALTGFSESAALELKRQGVHIHILYPGFVYTAMGRESIEHGMKPPPRVIVKSPKQVSSLTLARLGGRRIDINTSRTTTITPFIKMAAPRLYRRMMASRSLPTAEVDT